MLISTEYEFTSKKFIFRAQSARLVNLLYRHNFEKALGSAIEVGEVVVAVALAAAAVATAVVELFLSE